MSDAEIERLCKQCGQPQTLREYMQRQCMVVHEVAVCERIDEMTAVARVAVIYRYVVGHPADITN